VNLNKLPALMVLCAVKWISFSSCILQLKCDGTRWRAGGEVKEKLANGVGSQYFSHYFGTWCIQHYYRWCAQLGCQQSTELKSLADLNGLVRFAERLKSGFCACAITFQLTSTVWHLMIAFWYLLTRDHVHCIWYLIYLLTAVRLTPGGSSTVHIYTQTIHRTQLTTLVGRLSGILTQSGQTKIIDELTA